ncbi:GNAT family N-acetyltransferase [Maricaulis sp. CAU 1757]
MAVWRETPWDEPLIGQGIRLRPPHEDDYEAWARLRGASRAHTEPWEPAWTQDELSKTAFRRRIERYDADRRAGTGYPFFVMRSRDDVLLGACNLNNVRRGVLQSADIGYWIGSPYVRQGHTRAAVRRVLAFAFDALRLHRVEAACQPDNTASRTLLEAVGFQHEGLARAYLKIAGEWRDHDRFAILRTDPRP